MKRYFISGLVFLLPIAITIAIINFAINLLTTPFQNLFSYILSFFGAAEYRLVTQASSLLILICLFGFTLLVGAFVNWFVSRQFIRISEQIIDYIPLVGKIYKASKDVIHTLVASPTSSFKQVVMVPYPNYDSFCLGLLVKEGAASYLPDSKEELLSVFVPTTPNPTTGFIIMYPRDQVRFTNISVEDALKYLISCGMIHPPTIQSREAPLSEYLSDTAPSHLPPIGKTDSST